MTLGMISWIREEDFQRVKAKGLSFVELDVNDRVKEFWMHWSRQRNIAKSTIFR